jgi:hypothetical protein
LELNKEFKKYVGAPLANTVYLHDFIPFSPITKEKKGFRLYKG